MEKTKNRKRVTDLTDESNQIKKTKRVKFSNSKEDFVPLNKNDKEEVKSDKKENINKKKLKGSKFEKKIDNTSSKHPLIKKSIATLAQNKGTNKSFVKNGKIPVNISKNGPTDWVEFKKQQKDVRLKRKQNKNFYDVIMEAKKVGETLRRKSLKGGKEEREKITEELHDTLKKQGNYSKLVLSHDMARIVQHLLKFGSPKIREEISKELIPSVMEMVQSKYAKFCVQRMLKYGNSETRLSVINAFYGSVVKLASHAISSSVLAKAYAEYATLQQKQYMQQEFYGDMYKQTKENSVHKLSDVYSNCTDIRAATLGSVKANLSRLFNKELLDNELVHAVLADYLSEVTEEADRNEIITTIAPHAVVLSNTKEGAKAVMKCIWCGTNKDRKIIIKAFKEHVKDLACHEHAHSVFIVILDAVDDTVLVGKSLLGEVLSNAEKLLTNEWGRKVLLWLVAAEDSHHFHPTFINELKSGRESGTCKKSVEIRRQELLAHCFEGLLKKITENTEKWLSNPSTAVVTQAVITAKYESEELKQTLNNIAIHICNAEWMVVQSEKDETKILGVEHPGLHMVLKKIAQHDKNLLDTEKPMFSDAVVSNLSDETLSKWLKTNRGCFLLVAIFESTNEEIKQNLVMKIKPFKKELKKETTTGAKILLKKMKS